MEEVTLNNIKRMMILIHMEELLNQILTVTETKLERQT